MPIHVALHHRTTYSYDRPVTLLPQVIRLRPAPHCRTPIRNYSLSILPKPHFLNWQQDPYSNFLARLLFPKPVREFSVEVDLVAEMIAINPFDFFIESTAESFPFRYDPLLQKELIPYLEVIEPGSKLRSLIEQYRGVKSRTIDYVVDINQRLQSLIRYLVRMEPGVQSCEETLSLGSGSCRDTAWLMVQLLRHLGIAARFTSGYLIQLTADVKALDGPSGTERDFTDLHAWVEVYLPGAGWIGLDPTSGLLAGEGHIPLACTADPLTAAPISGAIDFLKKDDNDELKVEFGFQMSLQRVQEDPRVTKPYRDDQWAAIDAVGHRVDQQLRADDVRLTVGGEPTFVSLDDRDGPEWHTEALGGNKRRRAGELLRRLRNRFAPGGLLHFGQGKWYPGESLPRWALGCYWRKDGAPIWHNPMLFAEDDHDYHVSIDDAQKFALALANRLSVAGSMLHPAYEDVVHLIVAEQKLPHNVDPSRYDLEDSEERKRLARNLEGGLGRVVGFALPLAREKSKNWKSSRWIFRRDRLVLLPGDSPMGLRLPLDSLPWEDKRERQSVITPDPSVVRGPLAQPAQRKPNANAQISLDQVVLVESARQDSVIRTALCIEPRQGKLFVFMPPQAELEDYLDLVAEIELTADYLGIPVQLEGYPPPEDARLQNFNITPDPGVIEVNIQPAASWKELVQNSEILYEEARQTRLTTEKFMLDGRHTGTGGGNHIVLGGPTPVDSPMLRRPDLLRSLIGYWHNHPSLSYLFSGAFLGPTSQAPRIDEARNDSIYELELAFAQIPERGPCAPWLVDRLFRHLLTDLTGNTHRAEFCIDKLYSPDSVSGRRGLLEMRAFEMPPHLQMSLVQQLLLRSLIAQFWNTPYRQKLARWGTQLHDRFMLPYFIDLDFQEVIADLQQNGLALQKDWFLPHFEFRFPQIGVMTERALTVELRHAIEPWHVLGEENTAGGTARYVDSSLERIQVRAQGFTDRYALTCNGRRIPLHPTGINGEYVSAVRYRAWQPPSCLHPTIPVHVPLLFDIVDTWQERSIAGCRYHVAHPGGLSYDTFPVNANSAAARRASRFIPIGFTPGRIAIPPSEPAPESPLTLDLRRNLPS